MTVDAKRNLLVPQSSTGLSTNSSGKRVVSRMVSEALEIAKREATQAVRKIFKVGKFELCEPDYQQILVWGKALGWAPENVLNVLSEMPWDPENGGSAKFRIEGGSIKELIWDGDRLPIEAFEWNAGLELECLSILSNMPKWSASHALSSLRTLRIYNLALTELDLSLTPRLRQLSLRNNQLTELDISSAPEINVLSCRDSHLTKLDLSPVQGLKFLDCSGNQLTGLDLSTIPGLKMLYCTRNQLSDLDLSPVPGLEMLSCTSNELADLDLSPVPKLTKLWCGSNQLTDLELLPVPMLTSLHCSNNRLRKLELSPTPRLAELQCILNPLKKLDLRPLDNPHIRIDCMPDVRIIR